jgi:hypothetical protein
VSRWKRLKNVLARMLQRRPQSPPDPAERLAPVRRGPKGRSGAAVGLGRRVLLFWCDNAGKQ